MHRKIKPTILVIDDDKNFWSTMRFLLESAGYRVVTAQDGNKGIDIVKNNKIDLVITDLNMPGPMDGLEVITSVLQINDRIPVITVSTYYTDEIIKKIFETGGLDYLTKPVKSDILCKVVDTAISVSKL